MKQFVTRHSLLMMLAALSCFCTFGQKDMAMLSSQPYTRVADYPPDMPVTSAEIRFDDVPSGIANGYRSKFRTSCREGEPIWRPTKYRFYSGTTHYTNVELTYNTDGSLHIQKGYRVNGILYYILESNNTFTQEGWDFTDTLTYFQQLQGQTIPDYRYYYNYHYYDCLPEGCFFTEEYQQTWDISTKEWVFTRRYYERYRDTILFEVEEIKDEVFQNGNWIIWDNFMYPMTCCNEDGFETGYLSKQYDRNLGEFVDTGISEFMEWYPEGSAKEAWHYNIQSDGTLKLNSKTTDVSWTEWHGSGGWIDMIEGYNFEYRTISKLRNKRNYNVGWDCLNGEKKAYCQRKTWDIAGTETNIDSFFRYRNDEPYISFILMHQYDDHGNYLDKYEEHHTAPDDQGNQNISKITRSNRVYKYHELYDEVEDMTYWSISFENNRWDSTLWYRQEYYDWHDVTQPISIAEPEPSASAALSIFPNPVSGVVTIAAPSAMQQLSIYDITGRLVESRSLAGERVVFDTGALPQGVYLVRALLRDGGVRTGKVVKN